MLLTLQRTMRGDRYTMGTLAINGFEGIRIHVGNTSKDTKGCILVGEYRCKGLIVRSRITLNHLMERLEECPEGEPITLEVVSS